MASYALQRNFRWRTQSRLDQYYSRQIYNCLQKNALEGLGFKSEYRVISILCKISVSSPMTALIAQFYCCMPVSTVFTGNYWCCSVVSRNNTTLVYQCKLKNHWTKESLVILIVPRFRRLETHVRSKFCVMRLTDHC